MNSKNGNAEVKETVLANRKAKTALFDSFGEVAKALGSGRRAELIDVLAQGERHVEELAVEIDQSVANTSHHLQVLSAVGLVTSRREKNRVYYRLSSADVGQLWTAIQQVAALHHDRVELVAADYLGNREAFDEMSIDELSKRLDDKDLVIIDVRPEAEYRAGHIRGAASVPPDNLPKALEALPVGVEVVAYCRGPYCVFADEALHLLRGRKQVSRRFAGGFPAWRQAGMPVEADG